MALAVGPIVQNKIGANYAQLSSGAATGGTGPYTYQWYKSFTTGFTPGSAFLIPGATNLTLTDTQLLPATDYYYVLKVTDLGNGSATALSAQSTVLTVAGNPVEMNQLVQTPVLGQVDQPQNPNTQPVLMDSGIGATRYPAGTPVRQIAPTGVTAGAGLNTLPHVTPCTADSDLVMGFIQYSMRNIDFGAGEPMEISKTGNVQWQMATANGTAGDLMQLDLTAAGGLQTVVGSSGATICGQALDTPVVGNLFRLAISVLPKVTA